MKSPDPVKASVKYLWLDQSIFKKNYEKLILT